MVKPGSEKAEEKNEKNDYTYRGVRKRKWGKWVSEIRLPNSRQRIWLGSYDTPEKAARAFDAAMFCLRGHNGRFNFPDNPPDIAGGRSMTPSQIQAAAARFANSGPQEGPSGRPETTESAMECSSEGTMMQTESPSPSVSEGTVQTDSDVNLNGSFPDLFTPIGSSDYVSDYGIFPGFDDFYVPEMPSNVNYGEENTDGFIVDDTFLWNF
ncbi:DNA-binding domain superfamily [Sesbania bispinosa]|nr:DNA-binding domain superfamily [Sesbania bispinosa]